MRFRNFSIFHHIDNVYAIFNGITRFNCLEKIGKKKLRLMSHYFRLVFLTYRVLSGSINFK